MAPDAPRTKSREEFRIIKRNILLRFRQMRDVGTERANIVMVTAAGPGEGKTFTAANLAISLSQEPDLDVLLVDTDVSKPSLPSTFGISEGPGITDILADKGMHPEDVILRTNFERLSLVSAGRHAENSTEFFASERMRDVTDEISRLYHKGIVIFDSPPVLATSEATSLVMHVGQVVFVVEADGTDREAIRKSLDLLSVCPNIGMVLNKVRPQFGATEFGTYYHYYDRK
jgi:receptor protein-tyrosine kinase